MSQFDASSPGPLGPEPPTRPLYRLIFILLFIETAMGVYWLGLDLAARAEILPRNAFGSTAYAFVEGQSIFQEIVFLASVSAVVWSAFLFWRRRWLAAPVYLFAFMTDKVDWILLIGDANYQGLLTGNADLWGYGTLLLQLIILTGFTVLLTRRELR
ncbi:hypothetical protein [Maricaulis sp. CAU 1757]